MRGALGWGRSPGGTFPALPLFGAILPNAIPPSVQPGPGTLELSPAGLASTCPGRRAWGPRPALPVPQPCSGDALFPVQQYNRRRALGRTSSQAGAGLYFVLARDNPRCPGFLSPLGRASALGAETPPFPLFPRILGHTWLSPGKRRWQGLNGDLRGRQFLSASGQITLPLTLILVGESPSSTLQAA